MRKFMKFLHSLGACGMIGALTAYFVLLAWAPQDTAQSYNDLRQSIALIANYILLPSLGLTLFSGVMGMAVHIPFHNVKWVWVKAASGIVVFEGTLSLIGSKADHAARLAKKMLEGETTREAIEKAMTYEWQALGVILALSLANVLVGVWRPSFSRKTKPASKKNKRKEAATNS